jgi:hypothetical protein
MALRRWDERQINQNVRERSTVSRRGDEGERFLNERDKPNIDKQKWRVSRTSLVASRRALSSVFLLGCFSDLCGLAGSES